MVKPEYKNDLHKKCPEESLRAGYRILDNIESESSTDAENLKFRYQIRELYINFHFMKINKTPTCLRQARFLPKTKFLLKESIVTKDSGTKIWKLFRKSHIKQCKNALKNA